MTRQQNIAGSEQLSEGLAQGPSTVTSGLNSQSLAYYAVNLEVGYLNPLQVTQVLKCLFYLASIYNDWTSGGKMRWREQITLTHGPVR
jgi:hypothetical protein